MRRSFLALSLGLLSLCPAFADSRPFLDLDFEAPECTAGWVEDPYYTSFEARPDSSIKQSGQQSLRIHTTTSPLGFDYGSMVQRFPIDEAANKHIRLSGFIRTENVSEFAGIWWYALDSRGALSYADLSANGPSGTTPWAPYAIELDIPADVQTIFFGVEVYGTGTAWFDGLGIEVDGKRWKEGNSPHLPEPSNGVISAVRNRAIPLSTVQAGNGFADLQPLRNVLGSSHIVSLGESTHGTREIFQTKHRLLEFLATEMGFTYFAIEANMPEAYKVNEYVLTGVGDPAELLEGMYFWTWNTQEVLDMILWMREFNASGRGRLQFLGFDMQFSSVAAANVRSFLTRVEPAYIPQANSAFAPMPQAERTRRITAAQVATVRAVFEHLSAKRADYLQSAPQQDVDWAIQNARIILQDAEKLAGITPRDKSMAANVEWILDQAPAGSKIVLWAHNAHVSKEEGWMGKYLADRYGDDMYVLGFAFGEGRYNAVGDQFDVSSHEAIAPVPGSLETLLEATGISRFILDLRGENGHATWFKSPVLFRSIGAVRTRCSFSPTEVGEHYDGLIWLNPTSPSALLPFD